MAERVIPRQWINMQTGELTMDAIRYLNDLDKGAENSLSSVGTLLSGVNSVQQAIIAGTQPLADVVITGVGSVATTIEVQGTNTAAQAAVVASASGGLTAYATPSYVSGTRVGAGSVTTDAVTITASGGTGPYTYAWTTVSGTFSINSPASATTTFTRTIGDGDSVSTVKRCTVTDAAAATFAVDVTVSGFSTAA